MSVNQKSKSTLLVSAIVLLTSYLCVHPAQADNEYGKAKRLQWHRVLFDIYKRKNDVPDVLAEGKILCNLTSDAKFCYEYANFCLKLGKAKDASDALKRAAQIDPMYHGIYGDYLNEIKDYSGALREYKLAPGNQYASKAEMLRQYVQQMRSVDQFHEQMRKQE